MHKNFLNVAVNENINLKKNLLHLFPEIKKAALKIFTSIVSLLIGFGLIMSMQKTNRVLSGDS